MRFLAIILFMYSVAYGQDTTCVLDGSKSIGQTFKWQQVSGDAVQLLEPDSPKCTAYGFSCDGVYVFSITASSGNIHQSDSVTVTVVTDQTLNIKGNNGHIKQPKKTNRFSIRVSSDLRLKITSDVPQNMGIYLYDVQGRRLQEKKVFLWKGDNYLQMNKPAAGVYELNFSNEVMNQTEKIIVN